MPPGRSLAVEDARGARLGAFALATFAIVVALAAPRWPAAVVLSMATGGWLVVAVVLWLLVYGRR